MYITKFWDRDFAGLRPLRDASEYWSSVLGADRSGQTKPAGHSIHVENICYIDTLLFHSMYVSTFKGGNKS